MRQFLIDTKILVRMNSRHRHRECTSKLVVCIESALVCAARRSPVDWRRWRAPPTLSSARAGGRRAKRGAGELGRRARGTRPAARTPLVALIKIRRRLLCHRAVSSRRYCCTSLRVIIPSITMFGRRARFTSSI